MDKGKLILNIFTAILGIIVFIFALESMYNGRVIEATAFLLLVIGIIIFFVKLNFNFFDTSKDILAIE